MMYLVLEKWVSSLCILVLQIGFSMLTMTRFTLMECPFTKEGYGLAYLSYPFRLLNKRFISGFFEPATSHRCLVLTSNVFGFFFWTYHQGCTLVKIILLNQTEVLNQLFMLHTIEVIGVEQSWWMILICNGVAATPTTWRHNPEDSRWVLYCTGQSRWHHEPWRN
jgi:hypothetical protein